MNQRSVLPWPEGLLTSAKLSKKEANAWLAARPKWRRAFAIDRKAFSDFHRATSKLLAKLPPPRDDMLARYMRDEMRDVRAEFMRHHVDALYDALTDKRTRFVRVEDL